ncbi:MAG: hypothetical protein ACYS0C_01435 [Planctomycetota bacterium]
MEEEHKKKIEEIIALMDCKKGFECHKTLFEELCKARDEGLPGYVKCLEEIEKARACQFSLSFGYGILCQCPLRIYLAKNLKI